MITIGTREKVMILRENDPLHDLSKIELEILLSNIKKDKDKIMDKLSIMVRKWKTKKSDTKKVEQEFMQICRQVRKIETLIKSHN